MRILWKIANLIAVTECVTITLLFIAEFIDTGLWRLIPVALFFGAIGILHAHIMDAPYDETM